MIDYIDIHLLTNVDYDYNVYISPSLYFYLNEINNQIQSEVITIDNDKTDIIKTYEYLYNPIPEFVCSNKTKNIFYFELLEIFYTTNILSLYNNINKLNIFHFTNYSESSIEVMNTLRENSKDFNIYDDFIYKNLINICTNSINKYNYLRFNYDILIFEFDVENIDYIKNILCMLYIICNCQSLNGSVIIKIKNIYHKVIIDILYILSSMYDKVYIIKPSVSNVFEDDKFIVCKKMTSNNIVVNMDKFIVNLKNENLIQSIINNNLSYFFINKLEEINIIIGQTQLDYLNQLNSFIKSKNKEEKIKTIKKNNIQKCISWCEKLNIPYKNNDKSNVFSNKMNKIDTEITLLDIDTYNDHLSDMDGSNNIV